MLLHFFLQEVHNNAMLADRRPCTEVLHRLLKAPVNLKLISPWQAYEEAELLRLVYYGGVDHNLRKEVWPFLLGHYHFTMTPEERKEVWCKIF